MNLQQEYRIGEEVEAYINGNWRVGCFVACVFPESVTVSRGSRKTSPKYDCLVQHVRHKPMDERLTIEGGLVD